jgi:hypothetical protein
MWTSVAIATVLSLTPSQGGQLQLTNERATYGFLGSVRKETKLLPGDVFFLAFDIEGLSVNKEGQVRYSMGMQLKDSKGQVVFGQQPKDLESVNSLGGNSLPAFAAAEVGLQSPPGVYTMNVSVTDKISKQTKTLSHKFDVVKQDFGIVRLSLSYDPQGQTPAPPTFVAGQSAWVNFAVVGFERDGKTKNPDLVLEMRVLDDKGQPTLPKPNVGTANNVAAAHQVIPMFFLLELNRAGKFKIELKATDKLAKKSVTETLDISVAETK